MTWNDAEDLADQNDEHGHNLPTARTAVDALLGDDDAMARLYRTAERYARVQRDSWMARDLVWDVVGDLLLGDLTCDPERPIGPQLQQAVRRRANRLRRDRLPRRDAPRSIPVALNKVPTSALVLDAAQANLEGDDEALDPAELVSRIREQARSDGPAQQLLALYDRGVLSRRAVLDAGMTEWAYRVAKERLVAYATAAAAAASTSTPTTPDAGGAPDATMLPIAREIGNTGRPARVRRAVSRALQRARRSRSS